MDEPQDNEICTFCGEEIVNFKKHGIYLTEHETPWHRECAVSVGFESARNDEDDEQTEICGLCLESWNKCTC